MQQVAAHLGLFPFSEDELRSLTRIGTDRYEGREELLRRIDNEYKGCDEGRFGTTLLCGELGSWRCS